MNQTPPSSRAEPPVSAGAFLRAGAQVAVTGVNPTTLAEAQRRLAHDVLIVAADASRLAGVDAVVAAVREKFGRIDSLFINAGVGIFARSRSSTRMIQFKNRVNPIGKRQLSKR
ncbi:MAG: SDR family NAD(P)-dependent oxidoreductase [Verrucomicrobiota bacterium]|nr:SDR family NAD(P)-dependent oxidoreductase [Verrucomicrobiota bacterium]